VHLAATAVRDRDHRPGVCTPLGLRFEVNPGLHLRILRQCLELAAFTSRFQPLYSRDTLGRHILIGLTFSETREFERLDAEPPVDEHGDILRWEIDEESFPPNQLRWLELYKRHRAACILLGAKDSDAT
jgi:hypothetical protein